MKKLISVFSVLAMLLSGQAFSEEDRVSVEICKEGAISEGVTPDKMKEYIDKCVDDLAEEEKREQMEMEKEKDQ